MFQTQEIELSQEEFDRFFEFYRDHAEHYVRQRAHILLLRNNGYSVSAIGDILWLKENYVSLYIKAWYHFGLEGFLSNETDKLFNKIKEIETPKPVEMKPLVNWGKLFGAIRKIAIKFYSFLEGIVLTVATYLLTALLWLFSKIKAIDYKKFYVPLNQSISNKLHINRDSNNNIVFQMINVFNGEKAESKIASSLEETKKQFLNIFQNQKDFLSNSQMIALFLALNDKVQQIRDEEKRKRILAVLVTVAAMYVYYNTAIKGGFVIFTFLSMSFTIFNLNTCINSQNNQIVNSEDNLSPMMTDSILQARKREQFVLDSLKQEEMLKKRVDSLRREQEIADSLAQIEVFEEDDDCFFLAKKNNYVARLIEEDSKDHTTENYFVETYEYDNKFFLIVRVYDDIREAAFQREQLVEHGYDNSKIVAIRENAEIKYGLSIDEFTETKYDDAISHIFDWEQLCDMEKYKPMVYHNGLCKQ